MPDEPASAAAAVAAAVAAAAAAAAAAVVAAVAAAAAAAAAIAAVAADVSRVVAGAKLTRQLDPDGSPVSSAPFRAPSARSLVVLQEPEKSTLRHARKKRQKR